MKALLLLIVFLFPNIVEGQPSRVFSEHCVHRYADHYHIEPEMIEAFIDVESGWQPHAVSAKGAMGLMQLMPATAKRFGAFDPFDMEQNIAAGTRYVTSLMWKFQGDQRLVAAAYFAGEHWVGKKRLSFSNPEVIAYVHAVRRRYLLRKQQTRTASRR